MKIAILGAGAFGTALGGILANNGYDVDYYDSKVEKERLSDVLVGAKYVVLCVPSKVAPYLLPYLPKDIPLIVATKGILSDEVFADFKDWMVLSGSGFADDIKACRETFFTITDSRLEKLFKAPYVYFDKTFDRRGVLMCGALKNVYAMYAGYKKLKPRTNKMRQYLEDASYEMTHILDVNGANPMTVYLACGLGDLTLTCSESSRNYAFGFNFRNNSSYAPEELVEGLETLKKIKHEDIAIPEIYEPEMQLSYETIPKMHSIMDEILNVFKIMK